MRIDAHAHGIIGEHLKGLPIEEYVEATKRNGIDRILHIQEPEYVFDAVKKCHDFVIPIAWVNIDTVTVDELDGYFARGAKGIKFIAPLKSYGDDSYMSLYDCVRSHDGLAVFHTGYVMVGAYEKGCPMEKPSILDITNMRPAAIDRIVRAFPSLKILMAHFGNPWWEECWKIMSVHKNVYADLSGGTAIRRSMNMWKEIFAPNAMLDEQALSKLCFGSDVTYFIKDSATFNPYIDFYERFMDEVKAPNSLRKLVNSGNILKLCGN